RPCPPCPTRRSSDLITGMNEELPAPGDLVTVPFPLDANLVGVFLTSGQWRGLKTPGRPGLVGLHPVEPDLGIGWDRQVNTDRTLDRKSTRLNSSHGS